MKGVVFTELLEMVDEQFGPELTERVVELSNLASGGAYTAVGTYDHQEALALVAVLAKETGSDEQTLIRAFGRRLFHKLASVYPATVAGCTDPLSFAATIQSHIHVEVRKLYPDAELPEIGCRRISDEVAEITYHSTRPFAMLCHGLLEGSVEHFKAPVEVVPLEITDPHSATFQLVRRA